MEKESPHRGSGTHLHRGLDDASAAERFADGLAPTIARKQLRREFSGTGVFTAVT
jgi:hypothetical protein